MTTRRITTTNLVLAAIAVAATTVAIAQPGKDSKPAQPAGQPEMKLPPGWTPEDMQACMLAGTPGKQHEALLRDVGTWHGKETIWMAPGAEPVNTECTSTITGVLDGRFIKCEVSGEMPGMGPFHGFGIYGFDNVTQKYQAVWVDNCGTTMMLGTGAASADGKVMTWNYSYTCPVSKKPTTMREVQTTTGEYTKKLEMFATDPKSGKEFKMIAIDLTRKQ
jgi:hypothetical protein